MKTSQYPAGYPDPANWKLKYPASGMKIQIRHNPRFQSFFQNIKDKLKEGKYIQT